MFYQKLKSVFILIGALCCLQTANSQQCVNPVYVTAPGNNLQTLINNNPEGTCFYFPNGNYTFGNTKPKDNMTFEGESRSGVQINGNGFENAFHGVAAGVNIRNMTLYNFNNDAGQPLQEQAPIRGSNTIWAGENDPLASNWIIRNIESHSNIASGIFLGHNFNVTNSIFRNNGVTGIGGDEILGAWIWRNSIHHNGINQAGGAQVNGGGIKITKSGSETNQILIVENEVYDNTRIGIWGDVACHYWQIESNTVSNHESHGILYEVSDNASIRFNTLLNNAPNYSGLPGDWSKGGITIAESAFIDVSFNTVEGSRGGIVVQQTYRPAGTCTPGVFCEADYFAQFDDITLVCSDINIRNNNIIGASETGIGNAESGLGQLSASSNIVYHCNEYDNPQSMDFYGIDGVQYNYSQWQAAGMDRCPPQMVDGIPICRRLRDPLIDGLEDDWKSDKFQLNNIIIGSIDSNSDLSANFQVSWNQPYLYIYATIEDDQLVGDSTDPWEDDALEVYIDGYNEKGTVYDWNDHQFIFKLTDPNTVYYHSNGTINPAGVEYALTSEPGVSYVEVRIELNNLINIIASQGGNIGLDIHVNDDDNGGLRDSKLAWSATSDNAWNNPSVFETMTFEEEYCSASCDHVSNGNFDDHIDGWESWSCDATWDAGACLISNINDVPDPWNAAVAFPNIVLRENAEYYLFFSLITMTNQRTVNVKIGKGSPPWTTVDYLPDLLTQTSGLPYRHYFEMGDTTIFDGRLEFQVGTDQTDFALDNVSLVELYCADGELCENIIDVINPVTEPSYHANIQVRSNATISSSMNVSYYAGENIELNTNFNVEQGAVFVAQIQPCN